MNLPTSINLCSICGSPGEYTVRFLLPDARRNPASSGYGGDDISRCSDRTEIRCKGHEADVPRGFEWASSLPLPVPPTNRLFCCLLGCYHAAEYEIIGDPNLPDDYTHACGLHVGHLLSSPADATKLNTQWTVVEIHPGYPGCCDHCGFTEDQHQPDGDAAFCDGYREPTKV